MDFEFTRQKIVIRWALDSNRFPTDEDEVSFQNFGRQLEPILETSGLAEINGIEFGSGEMELLIFGKETDEDVDQIYELIRDHFNNYGCPSGSHIRKCYEEKNQEVICNEVA